MKRMQTLMCIVLALSLLLGLGLAGAQAESAGKIVVFQQKTEIYDQLVELAKAYQEETGVEVEVWPIAGDDYYQNLKTYMASESGPTVFTLNSASEIAEMSGYLADLSDLEVMGKVQENLIAMVDGKKTGVPMTAEGFGIIYNKDMVDPEAISTMDGLIAFIEEQKAAGVTGLGLSQEGYFLIGQILNFPFAVQDDPVAFCQQVFSGEVKLADVPEFQEFAKLFVAIRENQVNPLEVTYDGNCGDFATGATPCSPAMTSTSRWAWLACPWAAAPLSRWASPPTGSSMPTPPKRSSSWARTSSTGSTPPRPAPIT